MISRIILCIRKSKRIIWFRCLRFLLMLRLFLWRNINEIGREASVANVCHIVHLYFNLIFLVHMWMFPWMFTANVSLIILDLFNFCPEPNAWGHTQSVYWTECTNQSWNNKRPERAKKKTIFSWFNFDKTPASSHNNNDWFITKVNSIET